jgi:hypothetical protein
VRVGDVLDAVVADGHAEDVRRQVLQCRPPGRPPAARRLVSAVARRWYRSHRTARPLSWRRGTLDSATFMPPDLLRRF